MKSSLLGRAVLIAAGVVGLIAAVRALGPLRDAPTRVVSYHPPAALVARLAGSSRPGRCWTRSIAAPYRGDAWRCMVGNEISDPCFESGKASRGARFLVCGANPADPKSARPFDLRLVQPLPREPRPPSSAGARAWLVQLADGRICRPFTGTRPFTSTGVVADYGCAPVRQGEPPTYIFDGLNPNPRTWTAKEGTLRQIGRSLPTLGAAHTTAIAEVWQ